APCALPPFPTRRSSDLDGGRGAAALHVDPLSRSALSERARSGGRGGDGEPGRPRRSVQVSPLVRAGRSAKAITSAASRQSAAARSEEHTSELQSRVDLV